MTLPVLDINVADGGWHRALPDHVALVTQAVENTLSMVAEGAHLDKIPHIELSVLLTNDDAIQQLNREYRDRDKPTNVLSFPALEQGEIELFLREGRDIPPYPLSLGDIIIALETIQREAPPEKLKDHFTHLVIHGLLHLLGYDHEEDVAAELMEGREKEILSKMAIDDPYGA